MKRFKKCMIQLTVLLAIAGSTNAYALDTTETFAVGMVTDFELYYSRNHGTEGKSDSFEFVFGGGFTENFCYVFSSGISNQGNASELGAFSLGLTYTAFHNDNGFALDIMPAFSFDANKTDGEMTYPDGKNYTYGVDLECNIMQPKAFDLFLVVGISASYDDAADDTTFEYPVAIGLVKPIKEDVEFLMQFSWTINEDEVWEDTGRSLGFGLNAVVYGNLELTTEIGFDFDGKEFVSGLGLIYAL